MGKFSLENKIKDRLQGHEVHVDKRELWKALGIEEEEKDRKGIWFWWFAGLGCVLIIAGLWWFVQSDDSTPKMAQESKMVAVDENVAKTGNETINETTTSQKLSKIIEDVKASEDAGSVKETKGNMTSIAKSTNEKSQSIIATENNGTQNNFNTKSQGVLNENNSEQSSEIQGIIGSDVVTELNRNENILDQLPYVTALLIYDRELEPLEIAPTLVIEPVEKTRNFELELFGGAGTISRTLSTANSELDRYIMTRDSFEGVLEHISAGVSLKRFLGKGFYGKVGLTMNRWNEKYTYNILADTTFETVEIPDVILIDLQGNEITSYTEGKRIIYNTEDWVRYNTLTQIDMPITLGYEHRMNRWSVFGEASGILNLKQSFNGYLNTTEGKETMNPDIFKSRIGINMGLNAGIGYGFTPRLRARLSARYYKSLGSVLTSSTEIDQKYSSVGVRMGIGYLF